MFGPYGCVVVFDPPDSRSMAAVSPAVTNSGALSRSEAHELFESSDLTAIAGRVQGITYQQRAAQHIRAALQMVAPGPQGVEHDKRDGYRGQQRERETASALVPKPGPSPAT